MLKQRILTALVGLPVLLYVLFYGSKLVLAPIFAVFIGLSVFEISSMILPRLEFLVLRESEQNGVRKARIFDLVLTQLLALLTFACVVFMDARLAQGIVVFLLLASIMIGVMLAKDNDTAMGHSLSYVMTLVYGVFPWLLIWDLCIMEAGSRYLILLLAVVWSGDTGGYFGGRFFGKHPLAPRLSPKKTWEGAVAGILGSAAAGYITNACYDFALAPSGIILLVSVLGGAAGQLGDLVESAFKRFARIKDSGVVFPGHGGFLDRCDGLLCAAPVIWLILHLFHQT